jgi:hypothetical protein
MPAASHPMPGAALNAPQLLDVDVDQLARTLALVALGRLHALSASPVASHPLKPLGRALAILSLGTTSPAGAQSPAVVLAKQEAPTAVTTHRGLAVWSAWSPQERVYRLAASREGGPAFVLPVAPRRVPFDADLGPDRHGRPVAVYSRCRREPPRDGFRGLQVGLPDYTRGRGCNVWRYDFARGRERPVRGAGRRRVSEYLPSIWRERLAFARIDSRLPGLEGVQPGWA